LALKAARKNSLGALRPNDNSDPFGKHAMDELALHPRVTLLFVALIHEDLRKILYSIVPSGGRNNNGY
jgi:hypothetical protein